MLRLIGLVTCLAFVLVACGGGGSGGTVGDGSGGNNTGGGSTSGVCTGTTSVPCGLGYEGNTVGDVGMPYGPLQPTYFGSVSAFSVNPALPAGLSFDTTTGVISGTPLAAESGTTYTITASNEAGAATTALNLVVLVPPTALTYAGPATGKVGNALAQVVPSFSGDADTFAISPDLPDGLMLNYTSGILSGTPTSARLPLIYTVSAANVGGASTSYELLLTVDPPPAGAMMTGVFRSDTVVGLGYVSGTHSGLTDNSGTFTYEQGQAITFSVGGVTIGAVPTAKTLVTPLDLVAQGTGTSNRVLNVVRFLMMLDQDGNANNGIQISAAVTAAAASWAPVDFDSADLPTTLGPLVQQASAAEGVSHVLPDAVTAQAHLRTAFYCTHAGTYAGTFDTNSEFETRGGFVATVSPDGSMHSVAQATDTLAGFDVQTNDAVSPLLDATFAQSTASPSVNVQGSFADATYLSGTYLAADAGTFQALGDASIAAIYKFIGTYTVTPHDPTLSPSSGPVNLFMDAANHVGGFTAIRIADGTVSGNRFTGIAFYPPGGYAGRTLARAPVSGTYSNTASGVTLDGQYSTPYSAITFSAVGCRAN